MQESLFQAARAGTVPTAAVVDAALERDLVQHGGEVFHGSRTPRASVRRTLTELQGEGLVIKDGRGHLRIQVSALVDCIVHGDVLDLLRLCPDDSLPVIIADPAWTYMEEHTSKGTTTRMVGSGTRWFETGDLPDEVIREIARVLKPGGTFLCWLPPFQEAAEAQWEVLGTIKAQGLRSLREVTWDKGKGPGYLWAPSSEPCFVFYKHHRPAFYDLSVTNLIRCPRLTPDQKTVYSDYTAEDQARWDAALATYGEAGLIPPEVRATLKEKSHATEKPVAMLIQLLKPVLGPGKHGQAPEGENLVVELYAGTASASEAALRLGAHFTAVEKDDRNVNHLAAPRLGGRARLILKIEGARVLDGTSEAAAAVAA